MKRTILYGVCFWLMLASTASAQETSLTKSMWPFGRTKKATTQPVGSMRSPTSFSDEDTADSSRGLFHWASPTNMLQRAEDGTDVVIQKTRSTFKGMQTFGRRLNPFSPKRETKKKRSSFLSPLLPKKQPEAAAPATIGEFLSLPRPDF